MHDLIIIGGGPAGITAGIYATRKKLDILLISQDFVGQTGNAFGIENYTGFKEIRGLELMNRFREHLEKFEISIGEYERVEEVKKTKNLFEVKTDQAKYFAKALIIASGGSPKSLGVVGEKKFLGKGVSYCVTCDGIMFEGKITAVVGGGNAGLESALELAQFCPNVYVLESALNVTADETVIKKVNNSKKIKVITNIKINKIEGKDFVNSIIYQDRQSKKNHQLSVDGIFVEIGSIPSVNFVKGLVEFNSKNEIKIDPRTCAAKTPGLFAAGDVTDVRDKQIIIACGEGAKAALSAYEYLKNLK